MTPETNPLRPKDIGGDYRGVAQNLAGQARDAAAAATDTVRQQGGDLLGAAKDLASDARDKLVEQAQGQLKTGGKVGAEYLDSLAGTLDRVAGEFDKTAPFAGDWMRGAAAQVGVVADAVRKGEAGALVTQAQDFARRQPTAAFGIAMFAGFGLVRLLKSSSGSTAEMKTR